MAVEVTEDVIIGMENAGFPENIIAAERKKAERHNDCDVWEDNWKQVMFFIRLSTQWITSPMGQYLGIDYARLESTFRMLGIQRGRWRRLFNDVCIMEAAAVDYFNEKAKQSE